MGEALMCMGEMTRAHTILFEKSERRDCLENYAQWEDNTKNVLRKVRFGGAGGSSVNIMSGNGLDDQEIEVQSPEETR
jgi:hypothetical protein